MNKIKISALLFVVASLIAGCGEQDKSASTASQSTETQQKFKWKLVTSWPKNFPGLGVTPEKFAKNVEAMSNGRLKITVYGAGEIVPGFEVFDAVSNGTAEMGHSGPYYWKGKIPAAQVFSSLPFGMNAQEMNGWLHHGGGLALWQEVYKPFGIIPLAGGNTGVQMAGWFKKEINSLDDLKGLKMRIPGLGGEVIKRLGAVPVTLTGGELFTALQSGAIDATEWVGPYNDLAFGLNKAADYYYYSGWHEPGTVLEFLINEKAYNALPKDLQAIVKVAARAANQDMLDEYTARNISALKQLQAQENVQLRALPDSVMTALRETTQQVIAEQAAQDPQLNKVWQSYSSFYKEVRAFHSLTEQQYYQNR
ncbi:TRAP transporter substrate-binding protein [Flocculibacter collagenilyticus]|uniref:TRAP transporter substrate-binding protein n=1 Tax=Flocculibacter collagenilyticus TaxID=2744479 RepID=UPI0018F3357A|nr:TRAP transporter substrate-binding protein DctP [Flocculibacter collagenilyticus]